MLSLLSQIGIFLMLLKFSTRQGFPSCYTISMADVRSRRLCSCVQSWTAKAHKFSSGPGKLFSHNLSSDLDLEPSKKLKNGLAGNFPWDLQCCQNFGPILWFYRVCALVILSIYLTIMPPRPSSCPQKQINALSAYELPMRLYLLSAPCCKNQ